jgi:type II secretory pathway predicted ATPase ExeA
MSPIFDQPLNALLTTLDARMSAVLVAPSGTGKTMLLRTLCEQLPAARYRVHDVKVTSLSRRDMCREIAVAAGIEPAGIYPALMRRLQDHFRSRIEEDGVRPTLIIDECHDMRPEVLATLRVLTNFEMDSKLVLSLILAGDSRLRHLLDRHDLAPVSRRMAHCATLRLLSRVETRSYMEHRTTIVGSNTLPFDDQAVDAVFEITRGNLRAIDHVCLKSLEIAAAADVATIDAATVATARRHLLM